MAPVVFDPLWAVHISDGALTWPWVYGGLGVAALLLLVGAWRIRDEEIPQVALLTAAFFVASLIHVKVGFSSAHLLLNGLVGVVLGRRAALAIPVGLFLQAALIGHGGFTTLGINSCVMVLPALVAAQLFAALQRGPWVHRPWFRAGLVAGSALLWTVSAVYSITLLTTNLRSGFTQPDTTWADHITFHPAVLGGAALVAGLIAWAEYRLENAPEFPLGLLVGELSVLLTVLLNSLILYFGGLEKEGWRLLALLLFVLHLPIAVIEGTVLGFVVGFLARVKPEMIGWPTPEKTECSVDPLR